MKNHVSAITCPSLLVFVIALLLLAGGASYAFWSEGYDVAADSPHWKITARFIEAMRKQAIKARARDIAVPADLDEPRRIAGGASLYDEMCTGCHLSPGVAGTELREGLYPLPPVFPRKDIDDPAMSFWAIKHGIKLTAMPAWGKSHDDAQIWDMVAFLRQVRGMTAAHYRALVTMGEQQTGDHGHEHDDAHAH